MKNDIVVKSETTRLYKTHTNTDISELCTFIYTYMNRNYLLPQYVHILNALFKQQKTFNKRKYLLLLKIH